MNSQPNILFLMSDQHNAGSMGCAGHPNVKTPTLDALANDGIRFTRAYCNNPICSPSRITYVTGQYPHTHGFLGNNNFELDDRNPDTLGATFRRQGYQTAQVGKAHMIRRWDEEAY
ncbi:MAG: sulfatase-like hydrolase/transferase, partial [Planctomycetota bacterium]|nr:sulfatase-like hydrolase/transferase [Planctomycetota bacterium]